MGLFSPNKGTLSQILVATNAKIRLRIRSIIKVLLFLSFFDIESIYKAPVITNPVKKIACG
jgi:hypothetical protein